MNKIGIDNLFRMGDFVRCIETKGLRGRYVALELDEVYEVVGDTGKMIIVKNPKVPGEICCSLRRYFKWRFEKIKTDSVHYTNLNQRRMFRWRKEEGIN